MGWLENLSVGDKVIYYTRMAKTGQISTVARITKTMVVLQNGGRYQLSSGFSVGDSFYRGHISQATPEAIKLVRISIKRRRAINELEGCNYHLLENEKLFAMVNTLKGE